MVRTHFKTPIIIADENLNAITIRDTPDAIELAEKAGMFEKAIELYERKGWLEDAVRVAEKAGMTEKAELYKKLVELMKKEDEKINKEDLGGLLDQLATEGGRAQLVYRLIGKVDIPEEYVKSTIEFFLPSEVGLLGIFDAGRVTLVARETGVTEKDDEEQLDRFEHAARVAEKAGMTEKAIEIYEKLAEENHLLFMYETQTRPNEKYMENLFTQILND